MQTPASPRTFAAPMPSFMSVFDEEASRRSLEVATTDHDLTSSKQLFDANTETCFSPVSQPYSIFHQPRDSTSTSASESTNSSPTTTVSTADSASMTESSPGTSPETPASSNISPLSSVMDASRFKPPERSQTDPTTGAFFELQRPSTPAKRPRNLKNLAVNTSTAPYSLGRAVASASLAAEAPSIDQVSAPASPAFVKPPTPPRRKLTNLGLTIMTPGNSTMPRLAIPPTPSFARPNTLRHFQSSPSLPLCTPSSGPPGGMTLPGMRPRPSPLGFADIPLDEEEEDPEPNFDVPQSQEEKRDSYPNGPIRIYESGIDLYYEPTMEVASLYDVILNVASEVKNPFLIAGEQAQSTQVATSTTVGILEESHDPSSPDTPKATPITTEAPLIPQPEYIHIPWEHNTDIVPDLHRLVKLIDDRVSQGKRVLVHCQCGVSRSASLIVAYGLYKNPGMTVQEAYDAVKRRSKWIGPNMNLIMQLQEFRSSLNRSARREHGFPSQMFSIPRTLSSTLSSASTTENFEMGSASTPVTPRTAPLPPENLSPMRSSTGSVGSFSAGPVEPGQGSFWDQPGLRRSWGHSPSKPDFNALSAVSLADTPYVDTKGHVVPVVTVVPQPSAAPSTNDEGKEDSKQHGDIRRENSLKRKTPNFSRQLPLRRDCDTEQPPGSNPAIEPLASPRSEDFHMVGINKPNDLDMDDPFGILSPLRTEFPANPFGQLGQAGTTPERQPFGSLGTIVPSTESTKTASRNDSMEPSATLSMPSRNPPLRTKFSSPSLSEQRRLRQLQSNIEASLPHSPSSLKGYMDDLDALMSPRATEFTVNPWDELLFPSGQSQKSEPRTPGTPTKSEADPRSPAQHGISPITRNIFDVL